MRSLPSCHASNGIAIPIAVLRRCAPRSPTRTMFVPTRCSRPTAPTRCCRRLLLTYAGPGRRVATFEPTYQLHGHIARLTGAAVIEGERGPDFRLDVGSALDLIRRREARRHLPVLAEQPHGPGRAGSQRAFAARRPARPPGRRRGLRAVRRLVGAAAWSTRPRPWSSPAPSRRHGRWRRAASATSSARRGLLPSSTRLPCRITSTLPSRSPVGWRCSSPTRWMRG